MRAILDIGEGGKIEKVVSCDGDSQGLEVGQKVAGVGAGKAQELNLVELPKGRWTWAQWINRELVK